MVKVLIADDQALVRTGFRMILEAEDDVEVTGEAADGLEAVAAAQSERPDVILMDVRMPNLNGIEATRRLVDKDDVDPIRVLILTTFDLDEYVYDALRAGQRLPSQGRAARGASAGRPGRRSGRGAHRPLDHQETH